MLKSVRNGPLDGSYNDGHIHLTRDAPPGIAVVVGEAVRPPIVSALEGIGLTPISAAVSDAGRVVAEAGPFTFLIVGPDVLQDDDGLEMVKTWHRYSPSARFKLVLPGGTGDPSVLVRAIRAGITDVLDDQDAVAIGATIRAGMARAVAAQERVLAIGAHPDDVEIGCGGTLLDHRRRGDSIAILTLSRGKVGGDENARVEEATTTANAIGARLVLGDLPDTCIDSGIETIRLIEAVVDAVDPTVVYVHSMHDSHQDHRAVSTAARSATRGARRVFAYQSPSATNEFLPTQFVNIDTVVQDKVHVLQMFHSQDGRSYLEPELVVAGARYWARHLGANAKYAEPFEVIRSVGELRHAASAPAGIPESGDVSPANPPVRPQAALGSAT